MESVPEVGYAAYMSGVYKIAKVRMSVKGLSKLRRYGSKTLIHRNVYLHGSAVSVVE